MGFRGRKVDMRELREDLPCKHEEWFWQADRMIGAIIRQLKVLREQHSSQKQKGEVMTLAELRKLFPDKDEAWLRQFDSAVSAFVLVFKQMMGLNATSRDKPTNVRAIVTQWLDEHGYEGLYNPLEPCGCGLGSLFVKKSCKNPGNCRPGHLVPADYKWKQKFGNSCEYMYGAQKPKEES